MLWRALGFHVVYSQLSGQQDSEESKYWRKLMMKIAMRIIVLTLVLGAMNFGAGSLLSGPGPMPGGEPPVRANF